jgi:hypothetical protein
VPVGYTQEHTATVIQRSIGSFGFRPEQGGARSRSRSIDAAEIDAAPFVDK